MPTLLAALLLPLARLAAGTLALAPALGAVRTEPASASALGGMAAALQHRLDELRAEHGFPGATLGVVLADGTELGLATGHADRAGETPLRPADRMLSGSIGKTYVAAVALQLVLEGRLDLDERIATWLGAEDGFERLPNGKDVTLRMLLQHRSGIPEHVLLAEFWEAVRADPDRKWKPAELVGFVLGAEPLFPADTAFAYADTNYVLVGAILEHVTGRSWYELVNERVLAPLGLRGTVPADGRRIPGLVPGHLAADNPLGWPTTTIVDGLFVIDPAVEYCGGGLASTGLDLARWAHALYRGRLLPPDTIAEMTDARETRSRRSPGGYGLGVQVQESDLGPTWGHGGWFPGYLSEMAYFPEHGFAIAVQVNSDDPAATLHPREIVLALAPLLVPAAERPETAAPR